MSLFTKIRKFRRQCSSRLKIRQRRAELETINNAYPPESVKSITEIIADLDEVIKTRGITGWLALVEDYFYMGLNFKGRKTEDYVWFCEWMEELDKLFAAAREDEQLLNNKNKLSRRLAENGLRGTTGLGLLKQSGGSPILITPEGQEEALEDVLQRVGAIFCKPQDLYKGLGCVQLEAAPGTNGCIANGTPMSWEQFIKESVLADGHEMQAELVIRQHPIPAAFHSKAINTLRLTTLRDEKTGKPSYLNGMMRMGTGNAYVDNVAQGGVCVGIDNNGRIIGPGFDTKGCATPTITHHPTSGLAFDGVIIPYFEEAKELVSQAHALFSEKLLYLAWDVAITPDGPCIIECNTRADTGMLQRVHGGRRKLFTQYLQPATRKITGA